MNHHRTAGLAVGCALLLTGCATSNAATTPAAAPTPSMSAGKTMSAGKKMSPETTLSPGMVMPDGSVMGADPKASGAPQGPSASARMICGAEIRADVTKILGLKSPPATTSRWADHLYTCIYRLPQGDLVVSVKESPDAAATKSYFQAQRQQSGSPDTLAGLTPSAFGTPTGTVVLVKDNNTLTVDATALPTQFGTQHQKRTDLAYEVASVIPGCWTGD